MKQSELALSCVKRTSRNESVNFNLIRGASDDLSTGDRNVGRQRWRRQRGQADHTGAMQGN